MTHLTISFLVVLITSIKISGYWWTFSRLLALKSGLNSGSVSSRAFCSNLRWMTEYQMRKCEANPTAVLIVGQGTYKGIQECKHQFKNHRWNCTGLGSSWRFFEKMNKRRTPETAYLSAIASAGAAHEVTVSCSKGSLERCGCGKLIFTHPTTTNLEEQYHFKGCSDNVIFGLKYAADFLDPVVEGYDGKRKKPKSLKKLILMQNNKAGREFLKSNQKIMCKCHGATGSCVTKVCWNSLPDLKKVGADLRTKYSKAVDVRLNKRRSRLKSKADRRYRIKSTDLVFTHNSPDFCEPNKELGVIGTHGRVCNKTGSQINSCSILCCGRGYNTLILRQNVRCHCKFYWCCFVRCKMCLEESLEYRCK